MATKTKEEIAQDLLDYLQAYKPTADITSGNSLKDICVDPVATILEVVYLTLDNIRKSHSINYASELSDSQMDDLAANWNVIRNDATKAQGTITFIKYTSPTSTIRIGNIDGSGGVTVSTVKDSNGNYYSFTTTTTTYLTSADYNPSTERWETTATIEALLAGVESNVSTNSITVFTGVSGIDAVTNNSALTNGTAEETNASLASRLIVASQARLLGTSPGYATLVKAVDGVEDAIVITPGEEDSIRNAYGNEVDITILGSDLESSTDIVIFDSVNGLTHYLTNRPVDSVTSISGAGNSVTFIANTDYVFLEDTTSEYYGSIYALDKIVWLNTGNNPYQGGSYNVNYVYNKLINDVQDVLDDVDSKLIASNILAREGEEILVDMTLTVTVYSGTDFTYAESEIKTAITNYVNALGLGDRLEQSDIVFELKDSLTFVDNIVLPFTTLCRRGSSGVADLAAAKLEYFRVDDSSLTITVT